MLQIDTSSIQSAARRLEVIGNNIANINTIGFKGSNFEDLLGTAMSGDVGTKRAGARQSFSQGNVTASGNPLDVAISGAGFFRMENNGNVSYTRNGQFSLDKAGFIVNSAGDHLTGYGVDGKGQIMSGSAVPLTIQTGDSIPVATTKASLVLNLDANASTIPSNSTFSATDPATYTHSTTTTVYDAGGSPHDVQTFYIKRTATDWDLKAMVDGVPVADPALPQTLIFDASGQLTAGGVFNFAVGGGGQSISFDLSKTVQFGADFSASMSQDGQPVGQMTGYAIGANGLIIAHYSNGQMTNMGQLILANFRSPDGLALSSSNQWVETSDSGVATLGTPGSSGVGGITAMSTEDSNVDLSTEMINLISAQRAFQAAAEVVKKQDEIMQTVVSIGH